MLRDTVGKFVFVGVAQDLTVKSWGDGFESTKKENYKKKQKKMGERCLSLVDGFRTFGKVRESRPCSSHILRDQSNKGLLLRSCHYVASML